MAKTTTDDVDENRDPGEPEKSLEVYTGPNEQMVTDTLGWVRKPAQCALAGLEDMTGPCDTYPEFVIIDHVGGGDPGARYCHAHVSMAVKSIRMSRALGISGTPMINNRQSTWRNR